MGDTTNSTSSRVALEHSRFREHLLEQVGFLEASCRAFDQGHLAEFKRIAAAVRTLVHDTGRSTSLLEHLHEKDIPFVDSSLPEVAGNLLSHFPLIAMRLGPSGAGYVAICTIGGSPFPPRDVPFGEWWSGVVIKDGDNRRLTRRDLILTAANQDGGSHVDGSIEETYEHLARRNSLGWMFVAGSSSGPLDRPEAHTIRQIGWEMLETLKRRWP